MKLLAVLKSRNAAIIMLVALAAGILFGVFARGRFPKGTARGDAAFAHTEAILALGPRPPASDALDKVRSYLSGQLASHGWTTSAQEFERGTPRGRTRFANLRARFGANSEETWKGPVDLLLGCHIDSKSIDGIDFLGADDAASAAAAILVIARQVAKDDPARAGRMELIFFDGEESFGESITPTDGLYGSRHYARTLRTWDPLPKAGIILDMIGHHELSVRIPSDTQRDLRDALTEAARSAGTRSHFGTAPNPIIDDHVPLNHAGVPTINLVGDFTRSRWWHTSRDNIHLLDPASLDASIRTTLELIDLLLE